MWFSQTFLSILQRYIRHKDDPEHLKLVDLIARMLEYDPTKRISLAEAINHPFFDAIPADRRYLATPTHSHLHLNNGGDRRTTRSMHRRWECLRLTKKFHCQLISVLVSSVAWQLVHGRPWEEAYSSQGGEKMARHNSDRMGRRWVPPPGLMVWFARSVMVKVPMFLVLLFLYYVSIYMIYIHPVQHIWMLLCFLLHFFAIFLGVLYFLFLNKLCFATGKEHCVV